ncbi:hypothetical protein V8F33_012578 [Rhypophila sp. PSN 637]
MLFLREFMSRAILGHALMFSTQVNGASAMVSILERCPSRRVESLPFQLIPSHHEGIGRRVQLHLNQFSTAIAVHEVSA